MNAKELNSNGNIVLTKDAKMFKKLENENAKLKAELAEYKDVFIFFFPTSYCSSGTSSV